MKKLRLVWLVLLTACWVGSVTAQKKEEKLDFSGTWIMDQKKSATFIHDQRMPDPFDCDTKIMISQTDSTITMKFSDLCREKTKSGINTKETTSEKKYLLDKSGEKNINLLNEVIYSETEIKKKSLIIKEYKGGERNKKGKLIAESEYKLSNDGKNLYVRIDYYLVDFPNQIPSLPSSSPVKQYSQLVYNLKE